MHCKYTLASQMESQGVDCSEFNYINLFSQTPGIKNLRTIFPPFFGFCTFQQDAIWTVLNGAYEASPE